MTDSGPVPTDGSNFLSGIEVWNIHKDKVDDDLSDAYPDLVRARGGFSFAIIDNDICGCSERGNGNRDRSDSSSRIYGGRDSDSDSNDNSRSLTFYAIGGEDILDELPWNGTETLCYEY